jgi:FlaA1/EpsC-like NDP-sugar epimerase
MPVKALQTKAAEIGWDAERGARAAARAAGAKSLRSVLVRRKLHPPSRLAKKRLRLAADILILVSAFLLTYKLRFDFFLPAHEYANVLAQLFVVVCAELAALRLAGVSRFVWRFTGMTEARAIALAAPISTIPLLILCALLPRELDILRVPVPIILMNTVLAFGGILGARVMRRAVFEQAERNRRARAGHANQKKPILLVGAGRDGMMTAREIQGRGDLEMEIIGFVDDNTQIQQKVIGGIKVLGTTSDIPQLVSRHAIDHVVISMMHGSRKQFRSILEICESVGVHVQVIPSLSEILQGKVSVSRVRNIQIEDLLGREPVQLDEGDLTELLREKVVMVTGAGGSIGSEIVRQLARFNPSGVLMVERAEPSLFQIEREMREINPELRVVSLVADVCDEPRMRHAFSSFRPQVVFHAAAHKHVPMMESNPTEAIKNNTLATHLLGRLAGEYEVETFVLISTDKAVRPSSIMGASKRVAELVIQWLDQHYTTRYVAVRFGNVIGSTGSVIPIFKDQISKGGPVTVTHPGMVRYFMTIPEASQLVLQAGAMGEGGEIFILDMGEPVSILELAKDAITLSGLKPFEDIEIVFTGVRPGEKLFEELEMKGESVAKTRHPKIFIGRISAYPEAQVRQALDQLQALAANSHHERLREFLSELLPEAQLNSSLEEPANAPGAII